MTAASCSGSGPKLPPRLISGWPQSCTVTCTRPSPASRVTSTSPSSPSGYAFSKAKPSRPSTTVRELPRVVLGQTPAAAANEGTTASTSDGALASLMTLTFTLDTV